jgi:uncharacterized protein YcsI (UPF0317 family)
MDFKADARRTGMDARLRARRDEITGSNTGIASGVYCNLVVVPKAFASDFRKLCMRNTVSLPLLEQMEAGIRTSRFGIDSDISTDIPRYNVYKDGVLIKDGVQDITSEWSDQHVGFLMGCSFSLEVALAAAGLNPGNMVEGKAPPVYITSVRLNPSGVFTDSALLVSMRWYNPKDLDQVRTITRRLSKQHGEPVGWGWDYANYLGVTAQIQTKSVDFGEWYEPNEGEIPVFWGCGVTGQDVLVRAKLPGFSMTHYPG